MDRSVTAPKAIVVLLVGRRSIVLGAIAADARCDLALIDHLCRLQLLARRAGATVGLRRVHADLQHLLELAGVAHCFGG